MFRAQTCDGEIYVQFLALAVISDSVAMCHSAWPGPCKTGLE